jgi:hypothetical protein
VEVYELLGRPDQASETREMRDRFARALEKFTKRDFSGAAEDFRCALNILPEDKSPIFYLDLIEELRSTQLPPDWNGEIILKDK